MHEDVHGGANLEELRALGLDDALLLDFSVSTNPYGPHPAMVEALRDAPLARYPDPTALRGREALAVALDTSPDRILLGHGAAELLWAIARAFLTHSRGLLAVTPTFSEMPRAARALGARIHVFACTAEHGFAVDLDALKHEAHRTECDVVYLCAPATPTGVHCDTASVARWARDAPHITLVLDQSFLALSDAWAERTMRLPDNVIAVRSLTKEHAIAGVRAGYALGSPALLACVAAQRPAWSASTLCEAAAIATAGLDAFVAESRERLMLDRIDLSRQLEALGLRVVPSKTCFVAVELGARRVAHVRERLLREHAILIRDCTSFGLPACARIAARSAADRSRLIDALREVLD